MSGLLWTLGLLAGNLIGLLTAHAIGFIQVPGFPPGYLQRRRQRRRS